MGIYYLVKEILVRLKALGEEAEKRLISLCKAGKQEGFDLLFTTYQKYIYKICYYYTNSQEDALDLVQEVFFKLYRSFPLFDETRLLLPWVKRITINTCLNTLREKKLNQVSLNSPDAPLVNALEKRMVAETNVENEVLGKEVSSLLGRLIAALPKEMKICLILRHLQGNSYEEISKIMELPLGSVKTYLHRGRQKLKASIAKSEFWEV